MIVDLVGGISWILPMASFPCFEFLDWHDLLGDVVVDSVRAIAAAAAATTATADGSHNVE